MACSQTMAIIPAFQSLDNCLGARCSLIDHLASLLSWALCGILSPLQEQSRQQEGIVGQLLVSVSQLAVALILSAIAAYLSFYLFQLFTRDLDEWQALRDGNTAVGLVLGAMLVSVAIVLRPAIVVSPSIWDVGRAFFFRVLLAQAAQLAVGLVLAVLALIVALYLFTALTRDIDEVEELGKGNMAIASLLAGVVIGVGLMVTQAVGQVMGWVASLIF